MSWGHKVALPAAGSHSATVIFLHGLGDNGRNLSSIAQQLRLPHVKYVFPTAPTRPVSINNGMSMPAWFDLPNALKFTEDRTDDSGIQSSVDYVGRLVAEEVDSGIPANRVVVGGFSQGGHVALKYLLGASQPPAACIALSTWLSFSMQPISVQVPPANLKTPVFIGHGSSDPMVPQVLASATKSALTQKGFTRVELHTYSGVQHSINAQELGDVQDFLVKAVPNRPKLPTLQEVQVMSVRELKAFLQSQGVDTRPYLEKQELMERAKGAL